MAYILWKFFMKRYTKVRNSVYRGPNRRSDDSETQFDEDYTRDAALISGAADGESNSVPSGSSLIESSNSRSPATKKDAQDPDSPLQVQRQSRRRKSEGVRQELRLLEAHSRPPESIVDSTKSAAHRPPRGEAHKPNDKGRSKSHGHSKDKKNKKKADRSAGKKSTSAKNSPCRNSPVDLVLQTPEKVVKPPEKPPIITTKTDSSVTKDTISNNLSPSKAEAKVQITQDPCKSIPSDVVTVLRSPPEQPINVHAPASENKTVAIVTGDIVTAVSSPPQVSPVLETSLDEEEPAQKPLEVVPESKPCKQKTVVSKVVSRIPRLQQSASSTAISSPTRRPPDSGSNLFSYRLKPKPTLPPTREEEPTYIRYGSTSNLSPRKEPVESKSDLKTIETLLSSRFGGDRRSFFSKPLSSSFWFSKRQSASAVDLTSVGRSEFRTSSVLPGFRKRPSDVVLIIESTFRTLFSPFHEHSHEIIREARDLLVCSYLGSIKKFEEGFLRPAAALLQDLKTKERASTPDSDAHLLHDGWPLCYNQRVLVHLGETDSSLLKAGDFYLCVRQTASASSTVELVLKCRTSSRIIHEHVISSTHFGKVFDMDWLQSLHLETASDEQLTTLLQHMLVAVEKGIDRIRWENISRPHVCNHQASADAPKICPTCNKVLGETADKTPPAANGHSPSLVGKTVNSAADVKDSSAQTSPVEEYKQPPGAKDNSPRLSAPLADEEGSLEDEEVDGVGDYTKTSCEKEKVMVSRSAPNCKECILSAQGELLVSSGTTMEKEIKSKEQDSSIQDSVPEASTNEEQDDGYHDNPLTPPTSIKQVSQQVLSSRVALIPGCRDCTGRAVVTISATLLKSPPTVSQTQLAELLMYCHTVPRKELAARGLLILVDAREVQDAFEFLDEAFCLFEETIPGAINSVIVWKGDKIKAQDEDTPVLFPRSSVKYEVITSSNRLHKIIKPDQLLVETGGTYLFNLDEWIEFRQRFEPFVNECRSAGKRLVAVMQELRSSRLPPTSALTSQVIDEHKHHVLTTFEDPQLLRLQKEGAQVLSQLNEIQAKALHNADYRDGAERSSALFSELQRAVTKLARLADKRLAKLERGLQLQNFEEDCGQVLSWLCKKGEETLNKHKNLADNLTGLRAQERDFEKFYFIAMRHIEKGHDLLEEAAMLNQGGHQEAPSGVQDLSKSLKHHLRGFSEQLEDTRERLEDTSKCYQLLDKAYEWALEAMKFVSRMKTDDTTTPDQLTRLIKALQNYVDNHPPISEDVFLDMIASATKLENERLIEQCKVAQARCQETTDLIRTRQSTLLKAHQQMEAEGLHLLQSECAVAPSGGRPPYQPASPPWMLPSPTTTSTPLYPFTRRRSIAAVPACGHLPPTGYSSFFRESYRLDSFISEHDEMLAEDAAAASVVAPSHTRNRSLDARQLNFAAEEPVRPAGSQLQGPNPPLAHARPLKKYMKRSQTWQFEMDPWQKVSQPPTCNLHKDFQKGSTESIQTVVENEEPCSLESSTSSESSKGLPPVSVNSHLHHGGSSLNLQYQSSTTTDAQLTEEQMKHKRTLMLIMREMIQTERDYVKSLEYIIENYIPELLREDIPQALRGKRNVVFGNIEKIYEFHSQYFLHELEQCENAPFLVGHCFLRHERQFYLYALYNKNKPKSDELMLEYGTIFFKSKQIQLGDKMDLASYLLKPVQRMGKYALLLKQLLKECPEKDLEHTDLQAAEDMVKFQLRHGNDLLAMDCIRECDVDLKEQGRLIRQDEFIVWQGKYRKCLRQVFLFEELIVFGKARRDPEKKGHDIYQYKNSIKSTDIGLTEQVGESNTKFEIWFRKCKLNDTYTLQAANNDVKQAWVQEISKLLWRQALRNRELRLAEMSSMGIGNKPCLDIKPSEDQISDRSISIAQLTKAPRFRNSIAVMSNDHMRNNKRPHSIISVSSSSSGSSQSSYSLYGALNLGFDPTDSPKLHHRSITQQSQCSAESGIISDISVGGYESLGDVEANKKLERTNSNASTDSMGTGSLPISPASETSPGSISETSEAGTQIPQAKNIT